MTEEEFFLLMNLTIQELPKDDSLCRPWSEQWHQMVDEVYGTNFSRRFELYTRYLNWLRSHGQSSTA